MDADAWLTATNPYPMFDYLGRSVSPRKLRLFGIACCRRIWKLMPDDECREAVILAERLVEGEASADDAERLCNRLKVEYLALCDRLGTQDKDAHVRLWCIGAAKNLLQADERYLQDAPIRAGDADLLRVWNSASSAVGHYYVQWVGGPPPDELYQEYQAQTDLLREILGNPLRPVAFDRSWRTEAAVALARGVHVDRAFDRLPVLADALEDAGCADADLLGHCRGMGSHLRGCWAVDQVLGNG